MRNTLSARDFSMLIALLLIWAYFVFAPMVIGNDYTMTFVGSRNLSYLAVDFSITAILALGMLLVILPGHIDLAAGSGVGLFGAIAATLVLWHNWPAPLALLVALVAAIVAWTLMGAMIVKERVPAFIITLGGLLVFRGLHWKIIGGQTIPVVRGGGENLYSRLTTYYLDDWLGYALGAAIVIGMVIVKLVARRRRVSYGFAVDDAEITFIKLFIAAQIVALVVLVMNQFRGIPLPAVILGVTALFVWVLTQHTPFGRYLYAIGGNEEAAVFSGVPVDRVSIGAFSIMGLIVALTGFMQTTYSGGSTSTVGQLMELDAVAACVIGGTSLRGGRGSVAGVLFGALIMASLLNGMTLMSVEPDDKYIARGVVLILAVWMDVKLAGKAG
jgi:D-xylose transport system permease protein